MNLVYACLAGDGFCCSFVIPGQHDDVLHTSLAQRHERLFGTGSHRVSEGYEATDMSRIPDDDDGASRGRQGFQSLVDFLGFLAAFLQVTV